MFGMGFAEIVIIAIVAVIFLGPDKLPETMVNIAKFFRSLKTTVADAKDSLEQELHVSELKAEALSYKEELMSAGDELSRVTSMANLDDGDFDFIHDTDSKETIKTSKKDATAEAVTFEKKKKSVDKDNLSGEAEKKKKKKKKKKSEDAGTEDRPSDADHIVKEKKEENN